MSDVVKQCKSCPWRVDCDPDNDIPNGYSRKLHRDLECTIADGTGSLRAGGLRAMACHYSAVGDEIPCAGWLSNQLGSGNNIGVRMAVITGRMPRPEVDGDQHERFEDTVPTGRRRRRATRKSVP
jgi:Family of unknown function (DUF6283)